MKKEHSSLHSFFLSPFTTLHFFHLGYFLCVLLAQLISMKWKGVECKRELTEQKEHNRNNTKERMTHDGPFILLFLFGSFRASFVPHSITNEPNRKGNERGPWVRNEENSEFVSFTFVFLQMKESGMREKHKGKEQKHKFYTFISFPFGSI